MGLRSADVTSRAWQVLGGVRGFFADSWQWESAVQYGEGRTTDVAHNLMRESRLRQKLALDTPAALNVFASPGADSAAVTDAVSLGNWRTGEVTLGIGGAKATAPPLRISRWPGP